MKFKLIYVFSKFYGVKETISYNITCFPKNIAVFFALLYTYSRNWLVIKDLCKLFDKLNKMPIDTIKRVW